MKRIIKTLNAFDTKKYKDIEYKIVTKCPNCNISTKGYVLCAYFTEDSNRAYLLYYCSECNTCYLVTYAYNGYSAYSGAIKSTFPFPNESIEFNEIINKISHDFIDIYKQASQAEKMDLSHLSGIGYRKSVEFLIKDYCIYKNFDNSDVIKSKPLSQCIRDYIENEKIKTLARAAAWIGNDETHYVRTHEDYNIEHLKLFIKSMVAYIEYESAYEEASALTSSK